MFINFSSDKIFFWINWQVSIVENKWLEESFPKLLNDAYKNNNIFKIYTLNWPWWFTTLRICSLSINLLNFMENYNLGIFNLSKIDFYKTLVKKEILPKIWIIFIWQKKKVWKYNFFEDSYEYLYISDLQNVEEDYFVDYVSEDFLQDNNKVFLEIKDHSIFVKFKWKEHKIDINKFEFQEVNLLSPNYMVQPNISTPKN